MIILMYPSLERLFLTTGIFYLRQLLRSRDVLKVVLVTEFDFASRSINHGVFSEHLETGKLEVISGAAEPWGAGFDYHRRCRRLVKKLPKLFFDVLFMPDDIYILNNYLLRESRYRRVICYQTASSMSAISAYRDYKLQGLRDSRAGKISGNLKVLAWYFSGWASHINNYWLFPIMAGIRPFHKSRSFCLMNGDVGAQADYYLVFSEFDRRCCLEDKTSADKIIVNGHPLEQSPELYLELRQEKASEKQPEYDIVYFQTDLGFRIEEYYDRLLPPLLDSKLRVAVKLHPGSLNNHGLLIYLDELGGRYANLTILSETDFYPAAAGAKVIAGETTSVLEISSFIFKDKPIISVNLNRLPLGERYKGHHAIIYTEDIDDIVRLAESGAAFSSAGTKPEQRDGKPIDVLLRELLER